jgi:hypothetical protein
VGKSERREPGAWSAALNALRSRSSAGELLALYDAGEVTAMEILDAVLSHCREKPAAASGVIAALQFHPAEDINWVAGWLRRLLCADSTE